MPNGKLLVVEDDRTTASIIKMYLQNCDYQVVDVVRTGNHAIESAERNSPDLVLMDIKLDGEIDGITAANIIINNLHVPVVYITSFSDEGILKRAQMTNHSGFINKPVREVDLKTTINLAVNNHNNRTSNPARKKLNLSELASAYNLTKSESKVIIKLLQNPDLAATSDDFDITINTLRTHLKHIYKKTGTNSKAELLMKIVNGFDSSQP